VVELYFRILLFLIVIIKIDLRQYLNAVVAYIKATCNIALIGRKHKGCTTAIV